MSTIPHAWQILDSTVKRRNQSMLELLAYETLRVLTPRLYYIHESLIVVFTQKVGTAPVVEPVIHPLKIFYGTIHFGIPLLQSEAHRRLPWLTGALGPRGANNDAVAEVNSIPSLDLKLLTPSLIASQQTVQNRARYFQYSKTGSELPTIGQAFKNDSRRNIQATAGLRHSNQRS